MLMPKRVKHRMQFRGNRRGKATRGNKINYGEYGLVATEGKWVKSNQIEAARVALTRYIKRGGQVWIKIFPDRILGSCCQARQSNVRDLRCTGRTG